MNSFGSHFRLSIFGESHGPYVGITIDGVPPGIMLSEADFSADLKRRQGGTHKGATTRQESDQPILISGYFKGYTTGAPLTVLFENKTQRSQDYEALRNRPRPSHADFVLHQKFQGYNDPRGGGHSSGRLTVCLVAAGVVAKKVLQHLLQQKGSMPVTIEARLTEANGQADIEAAIDAAVAAGDSIGGVVSCRVQGLPAGLGEPFFNSAESLISHLAFSIPAIKGIEFGAGFAAARMSGSEHNDAIMDERGTTATNHAGGINGGITNGNDLFFRVAVKPASSTPKLQHSWDHATQSVQPLEVKGRHDLCIALRVPPVAEAITAIALVEMIQSCS